MKTVIDAVNEFKGVFPKITGVRSIVFNPTSLIYDFWYADSYESLDKENWILASTECQFNQCAAEMSEGSFVPKASKNMIETVYTQAMADNGELPSVGMKVLVRGHERVIMLTEDSDGDYITINEDGCYDFDSINQFKPPLEPVKLVDGQLYRFDVAQKTKIVGEAYFTDVTGEWMINALRTNSSYEADRCTNIIPLVPAT